MLLQTLRTRDFDELAEQFPWWKLRFRQFGRGPFQGQLQSLQSEGTLVFQLAVNRTTHITGWPPPGSFGCFPVLAANENAIWHGRRLKVGQVRVFDPSQDTDHMTAPVHYQLVGMAIAGDLYRQEVPVLGGFDLEERRVGRAVITANPAYCQALRSHLVGLFDLAQAQPERFSQNSQGIEQECLRRFARLLAQRDDDRTARQPSNRARLMCRAEDYLQANLRHPLSLFDLCRELAVSERTLHYAFQDVRGLSPMAYFQASRLNAVRQELKAARAGTATVYEIAQRWGFWHTGEFAAAYRRLFGELPSQSLKG
jgi:AraC family transcriptional regulator, ethanolamine operon transcriptional activator